MSRKQIGAERLDINQKPIEPQPAVRPAKVDQIGPPAELKQNQPDALKVRADMEYVLVDLRLQLGQHVLPGTKLAITVQLNHLIAELEIAGPPAGDVQIGQPALVDTHNGTVSGTDAV
jgi:multidrug resistance efflux pump